MLVLNLGNGGLSFLLQFIRLEAELGLDRSSACFEVIEDVVLSANGFKLSFG